MSGQSACHRAKPSKNIQQGTWENAVSRTLHLTFLWMGAHAIVPGHWKKNAVSRTLHLTFLWMGAHAIVPGHWKKNAVSRTLQPTFLWMGAHAIVPRHWKKAVSRTLHLTFLWMGAHAIVPRHWKKAVSRTLHLTFLWMGAHAIVPSHWKKSSKSHPPPDFSLDGDACQRATGKSKTLNQEEEPSTLFLYLVENGCQLAKHIKLVAKYQKCIHNGSCCAGPSSEVWIWLPYIYKHAVYHLKCQIVVHTRRQEASHSPALSLPWVATTPTGNICLQWRVCGTQLTVYGSLLRSWRMLATTSARHGQPGHRILNFLTPFTCWLWCAHWQMEGGWPFFPRLHRLWWLSPSIATTHRLGNLAWPATVIRSWSL